MAAVQAMMRVRRRRRRTAPARQSAHPTLVVMGTRDPDFDDPASEAATMAGLVGGTTAMIEGAGHYPHAEMPDDDGLRHHRLPRRPGGALMPRVGLTPDAVLDAAGRIADSGRPAGRDAGPSGGRARRAPALALQACRRPRRHPARPGAARPRRGHRPLPARHGRQGARAKRLLPSPMPTGSLPAITLGSMPHRSAPPSRARTTSPPPAKRSSASCWPCSPATASRATMRSTPRAACAPSSTASSRSTPWAAFA